MVVQHLNDWVMEEVTGVSMEDPCSSSGIPPGCLETRLYEYKKGESLQGCQAVKQTFTHQLTAMTHFSMLESLATVRYEYR